MGYRLDMSFFYFIFAMLLIKKGDLLWKLKVLMIYC